MWTSCPKNVDEPVLIVGLELEDIAVIVLMLTIASTVCSLMPSMGIAVLTGYGIWRIKRGQPPGALMHACHRLELVPIPGVIRPRTPRYSPW
jgi:hypothetical protein